MELHLAAAEQLETSNDFMLDGWTMLYQNQS